MVDSRKQKSRTATREAILQAANQVIIDKGLEALTLEAVAREAGVSKGGLLYHFPSKDALIAGTIEYLIDCFEQTLQQEFERDDAPGTAGQWLRAYVRATLQFERQSLALLLGLSNAVVTYPQLIEPAIAYDKIWQQRLQSSGIDPVRAAIIQLASDGLWFSEVFNFSSLEESLRSQVVEVLLAMARQPD